MSGCRATRQVLATTVAASLAVGSPTLISGCSFMAGQRARTDEQGRLEPAGCTIRMFAPGADAIIAGALVVGTLTAASTAERSTGPQTSGDDLIMGGMVLAALYGISALYGVVSVNTCRVATGMQPASKKTSDERHAEEAAEEAAVQAQLKARAAAAAKSADTETSVDGGVKAEREAPVVAPNQKRDDGR